MGTLGQMVGAVAGAVIGFYTPMGPLFAPVGTLAVGVFTEHPEQSTDQESSK